MSPSRRDSVDNPGGGSTVGANARTKRDRIVGELRQMIASGEIPRGSRMNQDALAARFNTSITPVREAFRQLEAEGILVAQPHRGVRVADADFEQVKTVYLLRRLIEPYAMRRAVRRMSPRDLELAERLVQEMEEAARTSDRAALNDKNHAFHFLFYGKTGNSGLVDEIDALWQQYPWDVLQVLGDRAEDAAAEHRELLAAARAGDLETVSALTEGHLANSFLSLARHLVGHDVPDPFHIDND